MKILSLVNLNSLNTLVKQFNVPVSVIHSSEVCEEIGMAAKRKKGSHVAYYHNGVAFIISDKIQSVSDTKESYLHEAILHKGLDLLFNQGAVTVLGKKYKSKDELLCEVFNRLDPELINEIAAQYTEGDISTPENQHEIAEEVLAKLNELERTPGRLEIFMDSLWKFIKKAVGFSSKQFTRTDLHRMLADHRKQVKKAARGGISESSDPKLYNTLDFFGSPKFRFISSNPETNKVIDRLRERQRLEAEQKLEAEKKLEAENKPPIPQKPISTPPENKEKEPKESKGIEKTIDFSGNPKLGFRSANPEVNKFLDGLDPKERAKYPLVTKVVQEIIDARTKIEPPKPPENILSEPDTNVIAGKSNTQPESVIEEVKAKLNNIVKISQLSATFWICASIIFIGILFCGTYYLVNKDNGRYQYDKKRSIVIDKKTGETKGSPKN